MSDNRTYNVGDEVYIPDSNLGAAYGIGKITAIWGGIMSVNFSGHLGHYTINKHKIIPAEIFGMKIILDETIPKDAVYLEYSDE